METYSMHGPELALRLPGWVEEYVRRNDQIFSGDDEKMHVAVELSRLNISHDGGPFGAAIFNMENGTLIAPGINLVTSLDTSIAHAEIVAILGAQQALGSFDLGGEGMPPCELFSSTEPCAMCLGAIPWSGIRRLVCGAADSDARRIGFDEGAKPDDWIGTLENRGISVVQGVLREEARAVLNDYQRNDGIIYNPGRN
jgi:tRNA(Arg) A34 adenosine deaminase TadA